MGHMSAGSPLPAKARVFLGCLVLAMIAAACGTTVPGAERLANAPGSSSDPFALPGTPGSGPLAGGPIGPGFTPGPTGTLGPGSPFPTGSGPGGRAVFSRGVTATKIRIGVIVQEGADSLADTFGTNPVPSGGTNFDQLMLDHLNSSGGIAGRQIEHVPYTIDFADPNFDASVLEQRACEKWTVDTPVFAAYAPTGFSDSFKACLAQAGVVNLSAATYTLGDESTYRRFPSALAPNSLNLTRQAKVQVDGLAAGSFFNATVAQRLPGCPTNSCVGLLTFDDPVHHRNVDQVLKPALAAHGFKLSGEHYFSYPRTYGETAQGLGQIPGVILRFKAAGINRIIIYADYGVILEFFARETDAQNYRPAYGITSPSTPQFILDAGNLSARHFRGSVNVGWSPMSDVGEGPGTAHGPGFARCIDLMKKKEANFASSFDYYLAAVTCDAYFFLEAGVEAGLPSITAPSFIAGVERLGTSFPVATSYLVAFGPGRHDGVAAVRNSTFNEACNCFKYSSGLRSVP